MRRSWKVFYFLPSMKRVLKFESYLGQRGYYLNKEKAPRLSYIFHSEKLHRRLLRNYATPNQRIPIRPPHVFTRRGEDAKGEVQRHPMLNQMQ